MGWEQSNFPDLSMALRVFQLVNHFCSIASEYFSARNQWLHEGVANFDGNKVGAKISTWQLGLQRLQESTEEMAVELERYRQAVVETTTAKARTEPDIKNEAPSIASVDTASYSISSYSEDSDSVFENSSTTTFVY